MINTDDVSHVNSIFTPGKLYSDFNKLWQLVKVYYLTYKIVHFTANV